MKKVVIMLFLILSVSACVYQNGQVSWGEAAPYELNQWGLGER